jgi:hypothetical protein
VLMRIESIDTWREASSVKLEPQRVSKDSIGQFCHFIFD